MVASTRNTPPAGYPSPTPRDATPRATSVQLVLALCAIVTVMVLLGGKFYATREELVTVATQQRLAGEALEAYKEANERSIQHLQAQGDRALLSINSALERLADRIDDRKSRGSHK